MSALTLAVSIGADFAQFDREMKKIGARLKPLEAGLNQWGAGLGKTLTLPLVAATAALGATAMKAASFGDQIDTMAMKTGLSVERLQELKYVASQCDVEFEAITQAVGMLTRKLMGAEDPTDKAGAVLKKLGVSVKDSKGEFRSMNDIFPEVIAALQNVSNVTERSALASQIFGRGFMEMKGFLALSGAELDTFTKRAHTLGLVFSGGAIGAMDAIDHKLLELKMQLTALVVTIGSEVIPVLMDDFIPFLQNSVFPALKYFVGLIKDVIKWFRSLPEGMKIAVVVFGGLLVALGPVLLMLGKLVSIMPFVIAAFGALSAAVPWLLALAGVAVVLGVLAYKWIELSIQQENARKATEALNKEMIKQAEILGKIEKAELPGLIDFYEEQIVFAQKAKAAMEAAAKPVTRTERRYNAGLGAYVDVTVTPEMSKEAAQQIKNQEMIIQGLTATLNKLKEAKIAASIASVKGDKAAIITLSERLEIEKDLVSATEDMIARMRMQISDNIGKPTADSGAGLDKGTWADLMRTPGAKTLNASPVSKEWKNPEIGQILDDTLRAKSALEQYTDSIEAMSDQWAASAAGSAGSFDEMLTGFRNMATQMIAGYIAIGVAGAVKEALVSTPFPLNVILAGIAGAAAATLFSSLVPKFATGGLAYGPTLAMVGDNPGASFDPEVIAPLSKLRNLGGRTEVFGTFRIDRRDLLVVLDGAQQERGRTSGR